LSYPKKSRAEAVVNPSSITPPLVGAERRGPERSEEPRSAEPTNGERSIESGVAVVSHPDPEVPDRARRRKFTAEFKLSILRAADACRESGGIGALLRKNGLYSSHLSTWRQERDQAAAGALERKRGPRGKVKDARQAEVDELRKEVEDLRRRLAQATAIIEVQKKVSEIFGVTLPKPPNDENA
jgi:transposase-like protein